MSKIRDSFKNRNLITKIIFGFILFVLLIPVGLSWFKNGYGPELNSINRSSVSIKDLTLKDFINNNFQDKMESACKNPIAFGNYWVRFHNEWQYRLFRASKTEKLILGKEDYFYEEMYITEYLGHNFIGDQLMKKRVEELKKLQDILKREYQIDLIPVIEPGKAHFSPEFIPDRYHPDQKGRSNYESFMDWSKKLGVTYLDLNHYFKELKQQTPHLLYSKYGVHWSTYGLWQAADTLTHFIENQCNIDLPEIIHLGDTSSTFNKDLDFDLEPPMNLLCELPHEKMNFPIIKIVANKNSTKPKVLTIGDSYYWGLINSGYTGQMFSQHDYWYYNKTKWPNIWAWNDTVNISQIKQKVMEHQIVLIMITDANLYKFGWEFLEQALAQFAPKDKIDPDLLILNNLFRDNNFYNQLRIEAIRLGIPFEKYLQIKIQEIKHRK